MKTLLNGYPALALPTDQALIHKLELMRDRIADVVNFNSVDIIESNTQPLIVAGRLTLWKDTNAGVGQPTHYLIMNDGSSTVTFASVETA